MKSRRLIVAPLLALALLSTVEAKDKWISVRTKNLNIISNAGEDDTRNLALKLEQFVYVVSIILNTKTTADVPVTVMVFKNDGSFKPFKPLYNGKPANLSGYFQRSEDENIIALDISARNERPLGVIFHEYTHLLTSQTTKRWPAWLMEGLAEYYSSFEVQKNKATLGAPISNHVFFLREKKFIPLQTLFGVDHKSPIYNEGEKQGIFYAQSWAFVHYLMLGEKSARQKQLVQFITAFEAGTDVERAFTQSFQTDFATVEKDLRRYIGNDTYPVIAYTLDSTDAGASAEVRPLTDAEVQFYLGNLLMRTNRLDDAEPYFKQALALDPNFARTYEGMGFLALRRSRREEAMEHFAQAVSRDSQNHLAHYYYAETLHREAMKDGREIKPETAKKIIDELKAALRPGFAPAYYLLGVMHLLTGDDLLAGERMVRTAMRDSPQNRHFAITLAQIQLRREDYTGAKKTLESILGSDADDYMKGEARRMIEMIESYTRPVPASSNETSAQAKERPEERAAMEKQMGVEGMQKMSGVLAAIECGDGKMVLALKTADKIARFVVADPTRFQFFTTDADLKIAIGCGPANVQATIYYKPPASASRFAGDAVAVELRK
jgi:tetratricopeptide (TPR) repeat protein